MLEQTLIQLLLLLGATVSVVLLFQRLHIPASLGYLLVGVLLGAHTAGPVLDKTTIRFIAEFGIVFLLFSIGLSFSFAQIYAMRHLIISLGTAQVLLTTLVVALLLWLLGVPGAVAFVIGAVFAQSSTTIISKQLLDQGEDQTRHGRLTTTMSIFQDITAVPFVVIIPVIGIAGTQDIASALSLALVKSLLAFTIVFLAGRYLLRSLFRLVAERRSAELFTLTVLFVSLVSAWVTETLGLSMAFGAFLAGMMLGETEFRHQVESSIRPFRDVLLGLFFVGIGMLINPAVFPDIWMEAIAGTVALLVIKALLVTTIVRIARLDLYTAIRTGLLLAVGGEFGFALLAIGLDSGVVGQHYAQIALSSVLLSMIVAPFLIRYNQTLASTLCRGGRSEQFVQRYDQHLQTPGKPFKNHVIICGYGRIGQTVANSLELQDIPFVALDLDSAKVRRARLSGEPVFYGETRDMHVLEALGIDHARLLIISHDDTPTALETLRVVRQVLPDLPIMVRTRDESHTDALREAGATETIPETVEAGMMMVLHALLSLGLAPDQVVSYIEQQRAMRYPALREMFSSENDYLAEPTLRLADRLHPVVIALGSPAIGMRIGDLQLDGQRVLLTALVRQGHRMLSPDMDTHIKEGDVLVLFGSPDELRAAELRLSVAASD